MGNSSEAAGLEGIVVASTALSDVQGDAGRLIIAGREVEQWAKSATFEEAIAALWSAAGTPADADSVKRLLGRGRADAFARLWRMGGALETPAAMDALRACVGQMPSVSRAEDYPLLVGSVAVFAAAWSRRARGLAPIAPDPSLGHAADFLRMLSAESVGAAQVAGLDAYFVTVIDHGMNASTFTARVITSTGADATSAVTGAIGALKGPLHGGAPGPVLDMLDAIGSPAKADAWLEEELKAGRRIMGMGHRIYRVRDPRAAALEQAIERLEKSDAKSSRLTLARAVEKAAEVALRAKHPDRPLHANVEFFTAVLLDAVGLPRELFSSVFAASRAAGWLAHVEEQRRHGRLIRPASRYVGPEPK